MMKITPNTKINDIVMGHSEAGALLVDLGLGCAGCHMSTEETIEEGCLGHGMTQKDVQEIVKRLNKIILK